MRKGNRNKILKKNSLLTALILLSISLILVLVYIFTSDLSLLTVSKYHDSNNSKLSPQQKLLKGVVLRGEFKAEENNLGILSIEFDDTLHIINDTVVFRIKDKTSSHWYYQDTYKAIQFYYLPLYPFGFPVIKNSKDKIYQFELESLNGSSNNAMVIGKEQPLLISRYKFSKSEILSNKQALIYFLFKKITFSLENPYFFFIGFIYILPFVYYLLGRYYFKSFIFPLVTPLASFFNYPLLFGLFFITLFDMLFIPLQNNEVYIIIAALWIFSLNKLRLKSYNSFFLSGFFLLLIPFLFLANHEIIAKKASDWAFIFLISATLQSIMELRSPKSATI